MVKRFEPDHIPQKAATSRLFVYLMRDRENRPYFTFDLKLCERRQQFPTFHTYRGRALKAPVGWPEDGPSGSVLAQ